MKKLILFLLFIFFALPVFAQETAPPEGWRFPGQEDFFGGWEVYRKVVPEPFHTRADFNGDGVPDDAWILLKSEGTGWGLFVFLGQAGGGGSEMQLAESSRDDAQNRAVQVAPLGRYKIIDESGKKLDLVLNVPALNLFVYEGGNLFFYWDPGQGSFKKARVVKG